MRHALGLSLLRIPVFRQESGGADELQGAAVIPAGFLESAAHRLSLPVRRDPRRVESRPPHHVRFSRPGSCPVARMVFVNREAEEPAQTVPDRPALPRTLEKTLRIPFPAHDETPVSGAALSPDFPGRRDGSDSGFSAGRHHSGQRPAGCRFGCVPSPYASRRTGCCN